jgi:hypothetical protein
MWSIYWLIYNFKINFYSYIINMFTILNVISCIFCYYMYNKTAILQRKIDFLEYEMVMLTNYMCSPSSLCLLKNKEI